MIDYLKILNKSIKPKFIKIKKKDLFVLLVKYNLIKINEKITMLSSSWVRKIGKKRLFILCLSIAVITILSLVVFIAFSNTTAKPNDSIDDGEDDDEDCF